MSTTLKLSMLTFVTATLVLTSMLGTAVSAKQRAHHRSVLSSAYARDTSSRTVESWTAHTGYRYEGPYDEKIVTRPNGIVIGTDPDPSIRAYMRRDNIGPNGTSGGAM